MVVCTEVSLLFTIALLFSALISIPYLVELLSVDLLVLEYHHLYLQTGLISLENFKFHNAIPPIGINGE